MRKLNYNMYLPEEEIPLSIPEYSITENTIFEDAHYDSEHQYPIYIILMHSGTPLANMIKLATRCEFTHACISFNAALNPLYSFGADSKTGGLGFTVQTDKDPFFKKMKTKYAIYTMFVSKDAHDAMKKRLSYFQKNKTKLKYDIAGLVQIFFGQATDYKQTKYFCSRFVMEIINQGNKLDKAPSLWKPEDIKSLTNISLIQSGNDFYHYSKRTTEKAIDNLKKGISDIATQATDLFNKATAAESTIQKYIKYNPSLSNNVSLLSEEELGLYNRKYKIADITINKPSDLTKVKNMIESCNKMLKVSIKGNNIVLESSPLQENITSSLYMKI